MRKEGDASAPGRVWVFGYGSLIWRADFPFLERRRARLRDWTRRFWQGSHDHRGVPHAPGRVVTLIPEAGTHCEGMAYLVARTAFTHLDHREKNGYDRHRVQLDLPPADRVEGVVYIAHEGNHAFLGAAPLDAVVQQIIGAAGPSGTNREYLFELARALRELDADDPHVFELEAAVRSKLKDGHSLQRCT